jgi:hypothetical protein
MHALRFAATLLWPTVPHVPPPGYRFDSGYLLGLVRGSDLCGARWSGGGGW